MSSPRTELADRLRAAAPTASVFAEEPTNPPALPALVVRPAQPYRTRSPGPLCRESWRLQVLALVPVDAVEPLEDLDVLIGVVRDVIDATAQATYHGVPQAPAAQTIGGMTMRGAIVECELTG